MATGSPGASSLSPGGRALAPGAAALSPGALSTLRKFARSRSQMERCEMCGAGLGPQHDHLIEPATRKLTCCCGACAILFDNETGARYRRVPRRISVLSQFAMTDGQWEDLHIPIDLAFFYRSSPAARVIAMYPSPAGATESLLDLESWQALCAANPVLDELKPDVEALLVYRIGHAHEYYRVPIDECFKLVGVIRTYWSGLSGGTEVWQEIKRFFDSLKENAAAEGAGNA